MLEAPDVAHVSGRSRPAPPAWLVVARLRRPVPSCSTCPVVNVALPSIRADLGMSGTGLQWVVNAYSTALAGFMLLGGRAGQPLLRRERMLLVGLGLFTGASLAGGLAEGGGQLCSPARRRVPARRCRRPRPSRS
ncbi:hypothetical protein SGRIM119S_02854 [Streptomyces griseorubiginosus]